MAIAELGPSESVHGPLELLFTVDEGNFFCFFKKKIVKKIVKKKKQNKKKLDSLELLI